MMKALHRARLFRSSHVVREFSSKNSKEESKKETFNPFEIGLGKGTAPKKAPSTIEKVRGFFSSMTSSSKIEDQQKPKTADDIYQELKKTKKEEEAELSQDASEMEKRKKILGMIESSINRKYFSEKKLDVFFEQCFALKGPKAFVEEEKKFHSFLVNDLKLIIQSLKDVVNIVEMVKFAVFFRIGGEDPEVFELLSDQVQKNIKRMTTDQVLTVLVNFSHSLSPDTKEVFEVANEDFINRLDSNFNASDREIYVQPEDFPKIINLFLDHRQMTHDLKQGIIDYLQENA